MSSKGRHVGASVAELRARLTPRDRRASAFPNKRVADAVVDEVLQRSSGHIRAWLSSATKLDLDLQLTPALPAGVVVGPSGVEAGVRVLVVLRRSRAKAGYTVVTAYPLSARAGVSDLAHLASFFGAYFHQDWSIADPPPMRLVARFAKSAPRATIEAVIVEMERLLVRHREPVELRARLDDLGLEYDPTADGMTTRGWLFDVRDALSETIAPAPPGAAFAVHLQ